jgi:formylglycine-generating enzyme required for sulfatase activity
MLHGGAELAGGAGGAGRYNLQLAWGSEAPVDALPAASSGVSDAQGNVWTWCAPA